MKIIKYALYLAQILALAACGGGGGGGGMPAGNTMENTGVLREEVLILNTEEDGTVTIDVDGKGTLSSQRVLNAGQVFVGNGKAFVVLEVVSHENNTWTIKTRSPEVSELFKYIRVSGVFSGQPVEGVASQNINSYNQRVQPSREATFGFGFSKEGVSVNGKIAASIEAKVDYEFDIERGGLVKGNLDVSQQTQLDIASKVLGGYEFSESREIGRVPIPIPLTLLNSGLEWIGLSVVSLDAIIEVGVSGGAGVGVAHTAGLKTSSAASVVYSQADGLRTSETSSESSTLELVPEVEETTDEGVVEGSIKVSLSVAPTLKFFNSTAAFGVKLALEGASPFSVAIKPELDPKYCLKSQLQVNIAASAFAKVLNFLEVSAETTPTLLESWDLDPIGSCKAPVKITIQENFATLDVSTPLVVVLELDAANSSFLRNPPAKPPSGNVKIALSADSCSADLQLYPNQSKAVCSLTPKSEIFNPTKIKIQYDGDDFYDPGEVEIAFEILSIKHTQFSMAADMVRRDSYNCGANAYQSMVPFGSNSISYFAAGWGCDFLAEGFVVDCSVATSSLLCHTTGDNYRPDRPSSDLVQATWKVTLPPKSLRIAAVRVIGQDKPGAPKAHHNSCEVTLTWPTEDIVYGAAFEVVFELEPFDGYYPCDSTSGN